MNPILKSMCNVAYTQNGALSYAGTGSACLDLFAKIGAARHMAETDVRNMFYQAALEDADLATRIMMWVRDCRGGAGERKTFQTLLKEFESWCVGSEMGLEIMQRVVDKTVELGRWDDLFAIETHFGMVVKKVAQGIQANDQLLLKRLPREKSAKGKIAKKLMHQLGLTPKQYRKVCSGVVTTETLMCAKKWDEINLSHVPSVAASRYQKAFERNHPFYAQWKAGLEAGTEKVNASVSFPHDIWRAGKNGADKQVLQAQWDALPNYIPAGVNILPIADVSGSMSCRASGSLSCMDVSISLGAYLATKNTGPFAGALITFHTQPSIHWMGKGNIMDEMERISDMSWGGSTNFQATFDLILNHAIKVNAKQEDMPQFVLCLSDMQFNMAEGNFYRQQQNTNFEAIAKKFENAGYKLPTLVFWNLNGAYGNDTPVTKEHDNVALVSGFSPAILQAVLSGNSVTPMTVLLEAVYKDRYKVL